MANEKVIIYRSIQEQRQDEAFDYFIQSGDAVWVFGGLLVIGICLAVYKYWADKRQRIRRGW